MLIVIIITAGLGYLFARLPGLIIGGLLGYWLVRRLQRLVREKIVDRQAQFLDATFAVMGCLSQVDGEVSDHEVRTAEAVFDRLGLNDAQRERCRAAFNRGQQPDFDLDAELARVRQVAGLQRGLLQVFLQVQLSAIAADGELHQAEHDMLLRVARGLGFSEAEIRQIEAMLRGGAGQAGADTSGPSLEEAYEVLGVEQSASDAEVKRAYRRLMSQNHPDKLAGKGLPENMREMAEKRTREIGNAYERIRKARAEHA
ncbi:co-chaperone DjlA [Kushneria phosphatilytica]|uniref:Co-chaperone DjlA n=1 Tax=Kushneria phosphatilytica TaxID=657387 RepID=A0A1S1NU51_9GAMM|nr:co-chaperone DjlA [Kushneria phosphatilytica]OHV08959.1 molecular chaperone DjlA [Kushneria phosphatilytica]QEL09725.1 co-chaperone DjlA [Kushneria phosphatilytica]